jgi:hypothetical protein
MEFVPVVGGAVGAAVAISLTSQHTRVARKWVAIGGAGVGAAVAVSTTGIVRQVATGAAIASGALAVYDFVEELLAEAKPESKKRETAPRPPTPPEESKPAQSADSLTPAQLAHLQAVAASLQPAERDQLERLEKVAPADIVRRLKITILDLSVDDAVAYLRTNVLARVKATNASSSAPP